MPEAVSDLEARIKLALKGVFGGKEEDYAAVAKDIAGRVEKAGTAIGADELMTLIGTEFSGNDGLSEAVRAVMEQQSIVLGQDSEMRAAVVEEPKAETPAAEEPKAGDGVGAKPSPAKEPKDREGDDKVQEGQENTGDAAREILEALSTKRAAEIESEERRRTAEETRRIREEEIARIAQLFEEDPLRFETARDRQWLFDNANKRLGLEGEDAIGPDDLRDPIIELMSQTFIDSSGKYKLTYDTKEEREAAIKAAFPDVKYGEVNEILNKIEGRVGEIRGYINRANSIINVLHRERDGRDRGANPVTYNSILTGSGAGVSNGRVRIEDIEDGMLTVISNYLKENPEASKEFDDASMSIRKIKGGRDLFGHRSTRDWESQGTVSVELLNRIVAEREADYVVDMLSGIGETAKVLPGLSSMQVEYDYLKQNPSTKIPMEDIPLGLRAQIMREIEGDKSLASGVSFLIGGKKVTAGDYIKHVTQGKAHTSEHEIVVDASLVAKAYDETVSKAASYLYEKGLGDRGVSKKAIEEYLALNPDKALEYVNLGNSRYYDIPTAEELKERGERLRGGLLGDFYARYKGLLLAELKPEVAEQIMVDMRAAGVIDKESIYASAQRAVADGDIPSPQEFSRQVDELVVYMKARMDDSIVINNPATGMPYTNEELEKLINTKISEMMVTNQTLVVAAGIADSGYQSNAFDELVRYYDVALKGGVTGGFDVDDKVQMLRETLATYGPKIEAAREAMSERVANEVLAQLRKEVESPDGGYKYESWADINTGSTGIVKGGDVPQRIDPDTLIKIEDLSPELQRQLIEMIENNNKLALHFVNVGDGTRVVYGSNLEVEDYDLGNMAITARDLQSIAMTSQVQKEVKKGVGSEADAAQRLLEIINAEGFDYASYEDKEGLRALIEQVNGSKISEDAVIDDVITQAKANALSIIEENSAAMLENAMSAFETEMKRRGVTFEDGAYDDTGVTFYDGNMQGDRKQAAELLAEEGDKVSATILDDVAFEQVIIHINKYPETAGGVSVSEDGIVYVSKDLLAAATSVEFGTDEDAIEAGVDDDGVVRAASNDVEGEEGKATADNEKSVYSDNLRDAIYFIRLAESGNASRSELYEAAVKVLGDDVAEDMLIDDVIEEATDKAKSVIDEEGEKYLDAAMDNLSTEMRRRGVSIDEDGTAVDAGDTVADMRAERLEGEALDEAIARDGRVEASKIPDELFVNILTAVNREPVLAAYISKEGDEVYFSSRLFELSDEEITRDVALDEVVSDKSEDKKAAEGESKDKDGDNEIEVADEEVNKISVIEAEIAERGLDAENPKVLATKDESVSTDGKVALSDIADNDLRYIAMLTGTAPEGKRNEMLDQIEVRDGKVYIDINLIEQARREHGESLRGLANTSEEHRLVLAIIRRSREHYAERHPEGISYLSQDEILDLAAAGKRIDLSRVSTEDLETLFAYVNQNPDDPLVKDGIVLKDRFDKDGNKKAPEITISAELLASAVVTSQIERDSETIEFDWGEHVLDPEEIEIQRQALLNSGWTPEQINNYAALDQFADRFYNSNPEQEKKDGFPVHLDGFEELLDEGYDRAVVSYEEAMLDASRRHASATAAMLGTGSEVEEDSVAVASNTASSEEQRKAAGVQRG